jgi:large subunit ribosomal protein L19
MNLLDKISQEQKKSDQAPFRVGDTVRVHTRVVEGDKERIQIFTGVVIARKGRDINSSFTVRRISYGEGVERVFPVHSPKVAKIEVERQGAPRRAKLYYLRDRTGKDALFVKERKVASKTSAKASASDAPAKAKKKAKADKAEA